MLKQILIKLKKVLSIKSKQSHLLGVVPKRYIGHFISVNPVIIEAGAHVGIDTVEMAKLWPKGTIYAFEPVADIFKKLRENTKACKNVKCFELALSNRSETADIFVSSGDSDGSSSLLKPKEHLLVHPSVVFSKTLKVKTITLDEWAEQNQIRQVDLLWLDLQGMELNVLNAGVNILKTAKAILTEVSLVENYSTGALYQEMKDWLTTKGFKVQREEIAWSDGGNVLFVREPSSK